MYNHQVSGLPVITISTNTKNRLATIFILVLQLANITACSQDAEVSSGASSQADKKQDAAVDSLLDKIRQRGKLIVLTTNYPTTYYYDRDNQLTGPEYDMTQSFAKSLKLEVEYKVYESTKAVLEALRQSEGDVVAAGLTITNDRKVEFDFGPVYQKTSEYLVCHRSKKTH